MATTPIAGLPGAGGAFLVLALMFLAGVVVLGFPSFGLVYYVVTEGRCPRWLYVMAAACAVLVVLLAYVSVTWLEQREIKLLLVVAPATAAVVFLAWSLFGTTQSSVRLRAPMLAALVLIWVTPIIWLVVTL